MAGNVRFEQRGDVYDVWVDDTRLGLICQDRCGWTTSIPGVNNLFPTAEAARQWVYDHWQRDDGAPPPAGAGG